VCGSWTKKKLSECSGGIKCSRRKNKNVKSDVQIASLGISAMMKTVRFGSVPTATTNGLVKITKFLNLIRG